MTILHVPTNVRVGGKRGGAPALAWHVAVGAASDPYARLKGVVILAGAVRASALSEAIGRSLLDLPLNAGEKLLDRWVGEARELANGRGLAEVGVKIMLDAQSAAPVTRADEGGTGTVEGLSMERDPFEFRGTGGVLHDVARGLADEDLLVVASGAQLLAEPLMDLVEGLVNRGGDVGIMGHRDGTPSGLMLIKCGALRGIAEVGFVDFKEQALPVIARKHRVLVENREAASLSVRTTQDYLAALRHDHQRRRGVVIRHDPFAEDWQSEFAVVENGAKVDGSARLFDSVVLSGGTVGAGAVLVRTVVCGGAVVKSGQRVIDQLVV